MEITQKALDDICDSEFAKGKNEGHCDAKYEHRLVLAQFKKLEEILEVEGDQNLMDAAEHLAAETQAHREAAKVAARIIEERRKELIELRAQALNFEEMSVQVRAWADKQHAADQLYIAQLQDAMEPMQVKIKTLTDMVNVLRQALLQHVKEHHE